MKEGKGRGNRDGSLLQLIAEIIAATTASRIHRK